MLISDRLTQINVQAFVHHIAEAKQQMLVDKIANAKFYSLLLDGSTDTGNIDNKV